MTEPTRSAQLTSKNHGYAVLVILWEPLFHGLHLGFYTRFPGTALLGTGITKGPQLDPAASLHGTERVSNGDLR